VSFEPTCELDELWIGELKVIQTSGPRILLVRLESGVFAYVDRCPHQGVALSLGCLEGSRLTCSAHGWSFDAATGAGINPRGTTLTPVRLRLVAGRVAVEVEVEP
jgi:toluene monooxygenase system ferredoxin subunit